MYHWIIAAIIPIFLAGSAQAAQTGSTHPVVLELFTSQGCSSCPPADKVLSQLAGQPGILALSYHVTYWNHLGWKDPYSFDAMTQRQYGYATAGNNTRVYTPQLIVQGDADVLGSDSKAVIAAAAQAASTGSWVNIHLQKKANQVRIYADARKGSEAELFLIGYLKYASNTVPSGENAGEQLAHKNSVVSIRSLGVWNGSRLDLTEKIPQGDGMAIIAQSPGNGVILGGGWIE